jgi:hypothetical protein
MHDHHPDTNSTGRTAEPAKSTATSEPAPSEGEHSMASHSMRLMLLCCLGVPVVVLAIVLLVNLLGAR